VDLPETAAAFPEDVVEGPPGEVRQAGDRRAGQPLYQEVISVEVPAAVTVHQ
jgi:hypothetical protein